MTTAGEDVDWQRVKSVFADALARAPRERDAFLVSTCGREPATLEAVRRLLRSHETSNEFLADDAARASPTVTPERVPETIGPYRLHELIGEGEWWLTDLARELGFDIDIETHGEGDVLTIDLPVDCQVGNLARRGGLCG